jgi:bifunctional non-homologous end joining protein LigD
VIGAFTEPSGSRKHFGALLLGTSDHSKPGYAGKVGTGFDEKTLAWLNVQFRRLVRERSDLVDLPRDRGVTFIAPRPVARISHQEWTGDNKLRQSVFLGLRDDRSARQVRLPEFFA